MRSKRLLTPVTADNRQSRTAVISTTGYAQNAPAVIKSNQRELIPKLYALGIPALRGMFYIMTTRRDIAEQVFYGDWCMPPSAKNFVVVNGPEPLYGPDCKVLWEANLAWELSEYDYIRTVAQRKGNCEIKPTLEFLTWLKSRMLDCPQVRANGGLHVLVPSLLKRR